MSAGGWHPDPTGRFGQRWYDGQRWTEHVVAANGCTITDVLPQSDAPLAPPRAEVLAPNSPSVGAGASQGPQPAQQWHPGPTTVETRLKVGATLFVGLLGLVLVALSLFGLPWISEGADFNFLDFNESVREADGDGEIVVRAYVGFLAFVLFVGALVGVTLAGLPLPGTATAARWWRIVVTLGSAVAAVLHTVAVARIFRGPADPEVGAWLGVVGYFVIIVAMVIGHYRRG